MTSLQEWKTRIDARLPQALAEGIQEWSDIPHVNQLTEPLYSYLEGGKRLRALMAVATYLHYAERDNRNIDALLDLACAIEFYQASALVHDDIIDQATQRRGKPALHRQYGTNLRLAPHATSHRQSSLGQWVAILAGDLLLSVADRFAIRTNNVAVMKHFSLMTAEVAVGQFLDIRADATVPVNEFSVDDALDVVLRKAANYSVTHPAMLGALLAGASQAQRDQLEKVVVPWGLAFQLRDDELGVTGDSDVVGKPVGNDLRTGKKTPLLAMTMERADKDEHDYLSRVVGTSTMTDEDINRIVSIMKSSGAFRAHEEMIAGYHLDGDSALEAMAPHNGGWYLIRELGYILTRRDS